ncbi:MAG TPA: bifunctional diguanylate cyclase/phosphodiesterase [Xanthobacteraceae bacterium]|nr:bifunctional diguanylate cyclase/phosphodiesterase [Xanthobacteraceae bacterium]
MVPSARSHIAGESKRSRWDRSRASLVLPIGVIVAVAIVCVIVAVLTSAQRADEVAFNTERQLVLQAVDDHGIRALHLLQGAAATPVAAARIREAYDSEWIDRRIGPWLEKYFHSDVEVIVDANDHVLYSHALDPADNDQSRLIALLAPNLDFMRGRRSTPPEHTISVLDSQDPTRPGRSAVLMQHFMDKPAFVSAVAVGSDADLAAGNADAPIVLSVKYLSPRLLKIIGTHLQLTGLRTIDDPAQADGDRVMDVKDPQGSIIGRFAWKPTRPGASVVQSVVPFIAVALAGFALLVALVIRHMRRTSQEIDAGERQLRHLALHDPVCGLPNRIYFSDRLERVIADVRAGGPTAAVFYIDLDHFKDVNDTLGHHIGDELILNVTQRLSRIMRGEDLVARLGGDEFAIITACESDSYSLQAIAGRIITAVCAPYAISGHNIIIGASIGIAVIDRRVGDAADILRYADMALYRAKNEGRNRACIYDAAMDADLSSRKLLEGDLLKAIQNGDIRAAYQPIVNSAGDTIVGVEALARWTHPVHGEIPPSRFIPIAEHSGLIVELGEYMLRRACSEARDWPKFTVAVNVSPLQFRRSDFVDVVERILAETKFDANRLELELTESTLLGNLETAELSMLRLKAIGVRFALDDFGTGYSSLLYLRRFPFDKLKIDSSFVRSIEKAPDAAAIVHAVVSLGRGLGMKVTAEGVETAEQHLFLRAAGVHSMQGYRFGKPGPPEEIDKRLASPDDYRVASPDQEIALAS